MKSDIEIAQGAKIQPIVNIAKQIGIQEDDLELYGKYKAKLPLKLIDEEKVKKAKLILVTAITPTPAGEGKTTTSIGLTQALNKIGKKAMVVLREPSLGPVFGIKGGAAGGGFSQVIPMEDINLHFTGDLSAVEKAHNLLAALIDNNIQLKEGNLGIDPRTVEWKRVMDMNERSLRDIVIGLGGPKQGVPRETGFNITAASEVMATLCVSENLQDLKKRLGNIFIGYTYDDKPIFARDLKAQGAMTVLLKDAIKPNLVQTLEGNPAIIHGGPFANIAQGTNTIIATKMGLSLTDYVVTEAGFASELGAEKFFNIKSQGGELMPNAVVIVATIRALKYHGGAKLSELAKENLKALETGFENLDKHIENMSYYGFKPVVAINKFDSDTTAEIELLEKHCETLGITVALNDAWAKGGDGATELAEKVVKAVSDCPTCFKPLYYPEWSYEEKIEAIATKMYGAKNVEYSIEAKNQLKKINELGLNNLAVCIAKTQKSLSDDQYKRNRPRDFTVKIREIELSSGAGFIVPIAGTIMRMPGLPSIPSAEKIDIDENGNIVGLF
ncbi:MAG: formate--tetrahydrofolate ligase [Bacteroidetes bacterium GWC2_33_15]|nr:MAG: formate--tetrahydrofolate ligase [Bacteroidetes bacterium GWA2_33_15]OFX50462.1 MAG: formate--tetrahydrofolate ligase [Bacteroidetes bacterium GWC2_33_15]OFX66620.1 MAG: formate--tetrahydrofolate ligase [Bacteroidetes bacterium GWB2_32_14]OFX69238.1 MAG: formate--tetrahydrofolate ligase [Bacteroidetes bacterium GWD2_33_33]HAN18550.1 formate--tetrahydrofolate ligase [Bacteroidales bacterium]